MEHTPVWCLHAHRHAHTEFFCSVRKAMGEWKASGHACRRAAAIPPPPPSPALRPSQPRARHCIANASAAQMKQKQVGGTLHPHLGPWKGRGGKNTPRPAQKKTCANQGEGAGRLATPLFCIYKAEVHPNIHGGGNEGCGWRRRFARAVDAAGLGQVLQAARGLPGWVAVGAAAAAAGAGKRVLRIALGDVQPPLSDRRLRGT